MENLPKIFIIILNHNGKDCLPETLRGVFSLVYPAKEVVLVDNASADGSLEAARRDFSPASIIKNEHNIGFAAGMNAGIKYALERGAKYVLLLNYDVKIFSNFLTPLVEKMEKDAKIGLASPVIHGDDSRIWFSGGRVDWWRMRAVQTRERLKRDSFSSDYITGCALLIRAEVFKKIGLLDEDYFLYYEDADLSLKAKKAGYKLLVSPESVLVHLEKSEQNSKQKIYWLVISGLIFFRKNTPWFFWPWVFVFYVIRRLKNWTDIKFFGRDTDASRAVEKAFKDFHYVR